MYILIYLYIIHMYISRTMINRFSYNGSRSTPVSCGTSKRRCFAGRDDAELGESSALASAMALCESDALGK